MGNSVYVFNSQASLHDLHVALEIRLQKIKALATTKAVSSPLDDLADIDEIEGSYWTTIEELAAEAEEIHGAIWNRVREQSMVESREIESKLKGVEDANIIS